MIYLEAAPSPPLSRFVRSLWYTSATEVSHERERVLPNGCIQVVISLASDFLTDCGADSGDEQSGICRAIAPAILVGARRRYDIIHMRDMAELVGVVFRPGGLGPWLRQPADEFFEKTVTLGDVWLRSDIRDRLREAGTPSQKLATLDLLLRESLRGSEVERRPLVKAALAVLRQNNIRETARDLGVSERRLHQVFCEDVGLSPKLWSRIRRFQMAVNALHSGNGVRWEQLALACGYYDQPHFSNDFRDFSGIDPTTYSERRGRWRNHVAMD
jgi:AraC-like DNA-binding protein